MINSSDLSESPNTESLSNKVFCIMSPDLRKRKALTEKAFVKDRTAFLGKVLPEAEGNKHAEKRNLTRSIYVIRPDAKRDKGLNRIRNMILMRCEAC